MTLHLWKIKVWSGSSFHEFVRIVEEVKAKVKDTATDRLRVDEEMFLVQVPSSGSIGLECVQNRWQPNDEGGKFLVGAKFIIFSIGGFEIDFFENCVAEVHLSTQHLCEHRTLRV